MAQFNIKGFDDELYRRCRVSALDCEMTMKEWLESALRAFLDGGEDGSRVSVSVSSMGKGRGKRRDTSGVRGGAGKGLHKKRSKGITAARAHQGSSHAISGTVDGGVQEDRSAPAPIQAKSEDRYAEWVAARKKTACEKHGIKGCGVCETN